MNISLHTSYQENISLLAHNLHEIKRNMETSAQRHNKEKETIHGLNSKQRNTMKVNPYKRQLCWFQTSVKHFFDSEKQGSTVPAYILSKPETK